MSNDVRSRKVAHAVIAGKQILTAGAVGTYDGQIDDEFVNTLAVELSAANATDWVVLPPATDEKIGRTILIHGSGTAYRLVAAEGSGNRINQVVATGSNFLTVPANVTMRCTQVKDGSWLAEEIADTAIVVRAPGPV